MKKTAALTVAATLLASTLMVPGAVFADGNQIKPILSVKATAGVDVRVQLRGKIQQLHMLHRENVALNQELRAAVKAYRIRARASLAKDPSDANVKNIEQQIQQIRDSVTGVIDLRVEKRQQVILFRNAIVAHDAVAAQATLDTAIAKAQALVDAKQKAIAMINSL